MKNQNYAEKTKYDDHLKSAERSTSKKELPPHLRRLCDEYIEKYMYQIRNYHRVAPFGMSVSYDSYICAFSKLIGGEFTCYSLVVGDDAYMLPCRDVEGFFTLEDMFENTYLMYAYVKERIKLMVSVFYETDGARFKASEHINEICFDGDDSAPDTTVLKVIYKFSFSSKNNKKLD